MAPITNRDPAGVDYASGRFGPMAEPAQRAFVAAIGAALMQTPQLAPMLQACTAAIIAHLPIDLARIWLLNQAERQLELWAGAGLFTHLDGPYARIPVGSLLIGRVAQEQRPFVTNDLLTHVHPDNRAWVQRERMTAFVGLPLLAEGRPLGVLGAFARQPLGEDVTHTLHAATETIAYGIAYHQAEDALQTSVYTLESRFTQALAALPQPMSLSARLAARQQADQMLRVDTARLRALLDALPDLIFVFNQQGIYLDCLAGHHTELILPRHEFIGKSVRNVLPPDVAALLCTAIERVIERHTVELVEYELAIGGVLHHREARLALCGDDQVLMTVRDITERKKAELALRESEARFRNMADSAPVMIWVTDAAGASTYLNPRWCEFTGTELAENLGQGWLERLHPDDRQRAQAQFSAANTAQSSLLLEYRLRRWDGDYRWVLDTAEPRFDGEGAFQGYVGSVIDIADRRRWEEALAEREAMLRTLGDNLPNGFLYQLITSPDGPQQYTYVSAGVERVTGVSPETVLRKPRALLAQLLPEDVTHLTVLAKQAMTTGAIIDFQVQRRVRTGELRWSHLRAAHRPPLPDGRIIWDGLVLDITDLKRVEQALHKSDLRYRALFQAANVGIALTDSDGYVLEVNEAFAQMLGYLPNDLVGIHFSTITHPDERADGAEFVERARMQTDSKSRAWFEKRYLHRDGSTVWVRLAVQLLHDEVGDPWLMTAVVQNITDVKQLEDQLRHGQKMEAIGRLAGGLAHDFNNLLTVINGYSDLLVHQMHSEDPIRTRVEQIRRAGERAAGLTRQLLAFSRKQVIAPTVLDLNVLVADLEKMLARLIGEHIHVSTNLADDLRAIKADPSQLEQVIVNLVVNARDAMPEGGHLTIATANVLIPREDFRRYPSLASGPFILLSVTDTGHGIDEETRQHIFEPFFTTKGAGKGVGLGLATTYGIVQQNGGVIELVSEVGRGATFKVLLPATDEPSPPVASASRAADLQSHGSETILLVEDDDQIRDLAYTSLTAIGYTVVAAANGEEALRVVDEFVDPIDLLISDVIMPGMNGRQLSERLLALQPGLKVLFVSGYPAAELASQGVLNPGIVLLPKPYTPDTLQAKIREMLDQ